MTNEGDDFELFLTQLKVFLDGGIGEEALRSRKIVHGLLESCKHAAAPLSTALHC
jgi:hypothetical protein